MATLALGLGAAVAFGEVGGVTLAVASTAAAFAGSIIDNELIFPLLFAAEGDRRRDFGSVEGMVSDEGEPWATCMGPNNRVRGTVLYFGEPRPEDTSNPQGWLGKRQERVARKWRADIAVAFGQYQTQDGVLLGSSPQRPTGIRAILADGKELYDSRGSVLVNRPIHEVFGMIYNQPGLYDYPRFAPTPPFLPTRYHVAIEVLPRTSDQVSHDIVEASWNDNQPFSTATPHGIPVGESRLCRITGVTRQTPTGSFPGFFLGQPWLWLEALTATQLRMQHPTFTTSTAGQGAPYTHLNTGNGRVWTFDPLTALAAANIDLSDFRTGKDVQLSLGAGGGSTAVFTVPIVSNEPLQNGRARIIVNAGRGTDITEGGVHGLDLASATTGTSRAWNGTPMLHRINYNYVGGVIGPHPDLILEQAVPTWLPDEAIVDQDRTSFPFLDAYLAGGDGARDQVPDQELIGKAGEAFAPGYRRRPYVFLADLDMSSWGNRPPNFEALQSERAVLTLVEAVTEICADYGLDNVVTDRVGGSVVDGYVRAGALEGTQALQPLVTSHDLIVSETEDSIEFALRSLALQDAYGILPEEFGATLGGVTETSARSAAQRLEVTEAMEGVVPRVVTIKYRDPLNNYDWATESVRAQSVLGRSGYVEGSERTLTFPEPMSATRANQIARRTMVRAKAEIVTGRGVLGPHWAGMREGDIVWLLKQGPDGTDWLRQDFLALVTGVTVSNHLLTSVSFRFLDEPDMDSSKPTREEVILASRRPDIPIGTDPLYT